MTTSEQIAYEINFSWPRPKEVVLPQVYFVHFR
jgi:hypothetical protein